MLLFLFLACKETKNIEKINEDATSGGIEKPVALYEDLEGNAIDLENYKGKRLLINYWATWCKPCIEEMPAMANAQEILKNENYVFLFPSDQKKEMIIAFRDKRQFGLNFIKYNGNYADLQIYALPVTILYNTKGEQVARLDGGMDWDTPELIEKLKRIE